MPVVPRSPETQISPSPLPGVRVPTPSAGAFDYGSGIQKATGVAAEIYRDEKRKADEVVSLEAINQGWEADHTLTHDPTTGALRREGKAAIGITGPTLEASDRSWAAIESRLTNDTQKASVRRARQAKRHELTELLQRHEAAEYTKLDRSEMEKSLVNFERDGLADFTNPAAVALSIERKIAVYKGYADRHGLGQEVIDATVAELTSQTHAGVVKRFLATHQDLAAKAYYEKNKAAITADDAIPLESAITDGTVQGSADRVSGEVWDALGPMTDTDPVQIDRMTALIRESTDDPDVRKAALTNLNQQVAVHHAAVEARAKANQSAIWNTYDAGTPVSEIYRTPEYLALSGTDRKEIRDKIASYQEKAALQARQQTKEARDEQRVEQEINYSDLVLNPVALRETDIDGMLRNHELSLNGHKALTAMKNPLKSQQARTALSVLARARTKKLFNPNDPADNEQRWATYTGMLQDFILQHPDDDPAEFVDQVMAPIETTWKQWMKDLWFGASGTEEAFAEKVGELRALAGESPAPRQKAPAVGDVQQGYRFKGGDPAQPSHWEKVP